MHACIQGCKDNKTEPPANRVEVESSGFALAVDWTGQWLRQSRVTERAVVERDPRDVQLAVTALGPGIYSGWDCDFPLLDVAEPLLSHDGEGCVVQYRYNTYVGFTF
jgi:hypothetical protein